MDLQKLYIKSIEDLKSYKDNPEIVKTGEFLQDAQLFSFDHHAPMVDVDPEGLQRYVESAEFRLPFPVMAIETMNLAKDLAIDDPIRELKGLILSIDDGISVNVSIFIDHPQYERIIPSPLTIQYNRPIKDFDFGMLYPFRESVSQEEIVESQESMMHSFGTVAYIAWLVSHRVKIELCPANPKLNKKRKKKGRLPYPDVRSLALNRVYTSYKSEGKGGHHASPRTHMRRGFFRVRNGKTHWVKSTVVNPDYNEKIQKIYVVERPNIKEHNDEL